MAAAAAALALAVGAYLFFGADSGQGPAFQIPPGRLIAGKGESVEPGRGEAAETLKCPDGSRFRVWPASRVRFRESGAGERLAVELDRGVLEAEVVKGKEPVRVLGGGGEIRVVGTCFTARAFRVHVRARGEPEASWEVVPVLSVEVGEGAVELSGSGKSLRVPAGRRGILWGGEIVLQEVLPADWRRVAEQWEGQLADPRAATGPVFLLSATWQGFRDWEEVLANPREPARLRRIAATLVGLKSEAQDAGWLEKRFLDEADAEIRLALLPHMSRTAGAGAGGLLARIAAEDPSEAVRKRARELLEASQK